MGEHKKGAGIKIITFLESLGNVLGYYCIKEEYMFPGTPTSPILDLTWRRNSKEKHPLFIFEIESTPLKSASDNAVKVFSRRTQNFVKPLFFFHVFVEQILETERVKYLEEYFDKTNYGAYVLSNGEESFRLFTDILDQHFRTEPFLDLFSLIELIELNTNLVISSKKVLDWLVNRGYAQDENSGFIQEVEELIVARNFPSVREFYLSFLPTFLSFKIPYLNYEYSGATAFSPLIHYSILLLASEQNFYDEAFNEILEIVNDWDIFSDWKLHIGLSNDHDMVALQDYPLLLTLLCAGFSSSKHSQYFSNRLRNVIEEAHKTINYYFHGLIWLLIASQIAKDEENYEFARSVINQHGGTSITSIVPPTLFEEDAIERNESADGLEEIPRYSNWSYWIKGNIPESKFDILLELINGFLIFSINFTDSRSNFGLFCLQRTISS